MKDDTKDTIDNYVNHGLEPGGFVRAVLENNLLLSLGKADEENRRDIWEICMYVYNDIPASCHGSPEKVDNWMKRVREGSI